MEYKTIIEERKDHIGIITLNQPEKLNAFTPQLAKDLNNSLRELDEDTNIRVVIIKGAGRHFCAGIDVTELAGKNTVEIRDWIKLMDEHNITIAHMRKPVIAAVHGAAVANGCGLVGACDLAIASEDARFGTTAIDIGLFCFAPGFQVLGSTGSRKRTLERVLTGETILADEAERIGLVNKVVPREKLEEAAMELAGKLASKSPIALQMGKTAIWRTLEMGYEGAIGYLSEVFASLCTTEDAHEGVDAYLKKRTPEYKGR